MSETTPSDNTEMTLKPCPFCGAPATRTGEFFANQKRLVRCVDTCNYGWMREENWNRRAHDCKAYLEAEFRESTALRSLEAERKAAKGLVEAARQFAGEWGHLCPVGFDTCKRCGDLWPCRDAELSEALTAYEQATEGGTDGR